MHMCSLYCGKCRPPHPRPVTCPNCGKRPVLMRDDPWVCPKCGHPLPEREKHLCNWTGRLCDIPCLRNIEENNTGELHECPWA